ncbi:hypothetical protein [Streptomyces sp. NPDC000878]
MPATTTESPDPLTMTDAEVAAILTDARHEAEQAAKELRTAELVLRGELEPVPGYSAEELTPARLAELRAAAEHATLRVPAAERRHAEIHAARSEARRTKIREKIRAEAASDLDGAEAIITALDAYEATVRGLCEAVDAHNGRITKWSRLMGQAGIQPIQGEGRGKDALAHMIGGDSATVGQKVYRKMRGAPLLAVVLHRVLEQYPRDFRLYDVSRELADKGDLTDSNGRIDVHALVRRDA